MASRLFLLGGSAAREAVDDVFVPEAGGADGAIALLLSGQPGWEAYVPGTVSGDGEEIDAYVLGVFEPVDAFEGRCIAVIRRSDDDDDKLVVVPEGVTYSDEQIRALVEFQERFFVSTIVEVV